MKKSFSSDNLITSVEAFRILSSVKNSVLVDVRTKEEFMQDGYPDISSTLKNTVLADTDFTKNDCLHDLRINLQSKISKSDLVIFICRSGSRSQKTAEFFIDDFLISYNVIDGFLGNNYGDGWIRSGLSFKILK